MSLATLAFAAGTARATEYYCGILVLPYTDCADMPLGDYAYGAIYYNQAYYNGSGTVSVCQHDYIYGTTDTVSRTCGNNSADSGCSLDAYYTDGYELRADVGNNSAYSHTIHGVVNQYYVYCD